MNAVHALDLVLAAGERAGSGELLGVVGGLGGGGGQRLAATAEAAVIAAADRRVLDDDHGGGNGGIGSASKWRGAGVVQVRGAGAAAVKA